MTDDYLSADWAAHHASFTQAVARLIRSIRYSFERLNAYEYDAPWRRPIAVRRHKGCGF